MMVDIDIKKVYAVEISGVCNLESVCTHCPMNSRPRNRKRGLMSQETKNRALHWVERLDKVDALALHNFGEPLIHPRFDEWALEFSRLVPITMSTNAVFLDERWADRLAKVPWAWISLSPWDMAARDRAAKLLLERGVQHTFPEGITHNWAGQSEGPKAQLFNKCPFLTEGKAVIRWDGSVTSCCVTDREEDVVGHIRREPYHLKLKGYSLCENCHHNAG